MPQEDMKPEYDFSGGTRGKFYREGVVLRSPVYLEQSLQIAVQALAEKEGKAVEEVVNDCIRERLARPR